MARLVQKDRDRNWGFGVEGWNVAGALFSLGRLKWAKKEYPEATAHFLEGIDIFTNAYADWMNSDTKDSDALQGLYTLEGVLDEFYSFVQDAYQFNPSLAAKMFDVLLRVRSKSGDASAALHELVIRSKNPEAEELRRRLGRLRTQIAQNYLVLTSTTSNLDIPEGVTLAGRVAGLEEETYKLQQLLQEKVGGSKTLSERRQITWQDIQHKLGTDE